MGMDQKARSIFCGMPGGGFYFEVDAGGVRYLPIKNFPYELETLFVRWVDAQPPEYENRWRHFHQGVCLGLSEEGWDGFARWMLAALYDAQARPDFETQARQGVDLDETAI